MGNMMGCGGFTKAQKEELQQLFQPLNNKLDRMNDKLDRVLEEVSVISKHTVASQGREIAK